MGGKKRGRNIGHLLKFHGKGGPTIFSSERRVVPFPSGREGNQEAWKRRTFKNLFSKGEDIAYLNGKSVFRGRGRKTSGKCLLEGKGHLGKRQSNQERRKSQKVYSWRRFFCQGR